MIRAFAARLRDNSRRILEFLGLDITLYFSADKSKLLSRVIPNRTCESISEV